MFGDAEFDEGPSGRLWESSPSCEILKNKLCLYVFCDSEFDEGPSGILWESSPIGEILKNNLFLYFGDAEFDEGLSGNDHRFPIHTKLHCLITCIHPRFPPAEK